MSVRAVALIYRAVTPVTAAIAVARVLGVGTPQFAPGGLLYYTTLSNLLGLVWILVAFVFTVRRVASFGWRGDASVTPRVGAGVGLALLVTMFIYLVVLAPSAFVQDGSYEPFTLTDNLVHIVVPILVFADWLLFARKGELRWIDPLLWAVVPYSYVAFALLRPVFTDAEWPSGGQYPYPFFDPTEQGWGGVIVGLVVMTVAIEAVAFGIIALDRFLAKLSSKRHANLDAV